MSSNGTYRIGAEHQDMHRYVQENLPWYVNHTLDPADAELVETHLGGCRACREQLAETHALASVVRAEAVGRWDPSPQHFASLLARIDAAEVQPVRASAHAWTWRRAIDWLGQFAAIPRWAAVAQGALSLVLVAALLWSQVPAPSLYQTYSESDGPETGQGAELYLQVADDLEVGELQRLLESVGATIVTGPSSVGHFRLRVANTDPVGLAQDLARLRGHPKVRLAEAAPSPDGAR